MRSVRKISWTTARWFAVAALDPDVLKEVGPQAVADLLEALGVRSAARGRASDFAEVRRRAEEADEAVDVGGCRGCSRIARDVLLLLAAIEASRASE